MTRTVRTRALRWAVGAVLLATGAAAAPSAMKAPERRAAVVQAVSDCRPITDSAARLACFDKAAAILDQAESKGQVVVIDREQANTVRRQAFGFTLPAFSLFDRGQKEEQVDRISITLTGASEDHNRNWTLVSADGVWIQTDGEELQHDPHPGSTVAIRKAALGSYFCNIDGQRAVRCERRK